MATKLEEKQIPKIYLELFVIQQLLVNFMIKGHWTVYKHRKNAVQCKLSKVVMNLGSQLSEELTTQCKAKNNFHFSW